MSEPEALGGLVDARLRQASTTTSVSGYRLAQTAIPRRVWLPNKPREAKEIDPALRQVISRLARGEGRWPLVLLGAAGLGKTCAGLCMLDHAGGIYLTASGLAEVAILAIKGQLRTPDGRHPVSACGFWANISETTLVVLDELGSRERVGDWHYEQLKRVLDEREGRPLVAMSNLTLGQLTQTYDDRVTSRLAAGTVVELTGHDRRIKNV